LGIVIILIHIYNTAHFFSLTTIALLFFFTIAVLESSVKVILEKLESLSEDNRDLKNKIRLLQAQGSINVDSAIVFKYPPLPLKDEEELKKTEENIVDPIQFQQLVRPKQIINILITRS